MAASTISRRFHQFGINPLLNSTKFMELYALNAAIHANNAADNRLYSSFSPRHGSRYIDTKSISQLVSSHGRRLFLVDTLALVSSMILIL